MERGRGGLRGGRLVRVMPGLDEKDKFIHAVIQGISLKQEKIKYIRGNRTMINRPRVAGAVLQTAL